MHCSEDRLVLRLPMPPTVNHYYATIMLGKGKSARARRVVSAAGRKFVQHVREYQLEHNVPHCNGRLYVEGFLFFPTRAGDVDNRTKPTLDALQQAAIFTNDSQVDRVDFRRVASKHEKPGSLVLRITRWDAQQNDLRPEQWVDCLMREKLQHGRMIE